MINKQTSLGIGTVVLIFWTTDRMEVFGLAKDLSA